MVAGLSWHINGEHEENHAVMRTSTSLGTSATLGDAVAGVGPKPSLDSCRECVRASWWSGRCKDTYERTHIFTTVRAESARCHGMEALLVGFVNYAEGAQLCIGLLVA